MGYYTYYRMNARHIKNEEEYNSIVYALKEREIMASEDRCGVFDVSQYDEVNHSAYFEAYEECKWYEHEYDMVKFSKLFPNVTFQLHGEGEEKEDLWNKYFHNGEAEECTAEIRYPTPVYIKWDE